MFRVQTCCWRTLQACPKMQSSLDSLSVYTKERYATKIAEMPTEKLWLVWPMQSLWPNHQEDVMISYSSKDAEGPKQSERLNFSQFDMAESFRLAADSTP